MMFAYVRRVRRCLRVAPVVVSVAAFALLLAAVKPGAVSGDPAPWTPPKVPTISRIALDPAGHPWVIGYDGQAEGGFVAWHDGGAWHALPSPPVIRPYGVLPLALDDVWLVAGRRIVHWDGAAWQVTPHPTIRGSGFTDIAALAPDDVWAVGRQDGRLISLPGDEGGARTRLDKPLTMHWDGTTWTSVPTPSLPGIDQGLAAVSAGGGRVWAVGEIRRLAGAVDVGGSTAPLFRSAPLALELRGGVWRRVYHANAGRGGTELRDVEVLPGGIVWVVGKVMVDPDYAELERAYTLVERRRGAHWVVKQQRVWKWAFAPWAIAATSCREVWLAGMDAGGYPAAERWDGLGWRLFAGEDLFWTQQYGMTGTAVPDIDASPAGVWLQGGWTTFADGGDAVGDPLVWRWDGSWTKVAFELRE